MKNFKAIAASVLSLAILTPAYAENLGQVVSERSFTAGAAVSPASLHQTALPMNPQVPLAPSAVTGVQVQVAPAAAASVQAEVSQRTVSKRAQASLTLLKSSIAKPENAPQNLDQAYSKSEARLSDDSAVPESARPQAPRSSLAKPSAFKRVAAGASAFALSSLAAFAAGSPHQAMMAAAIAPTTTLKIINFAIGIGVMIGVWMVQGRVVRKLIYKYGPEKMQKIQIGVMIGAIAVMWVGSSLIQNVVDSLLAPHLMGSALASAPMTTAPAATIPPTPSISAVSNSVASSIPQMSAAPAAHVAAMHGAAHAVAASAPAAKGDSLGNFFGILGGLGIGMAGISFLTKITSRIKANMQDSPARGLTLLSMVLSVGAAAVYVGIKLGFWIHALTLTAFTSTPGAAGVEIAVALSVVALLVVKSGFFKMMRHDLKNIRDDRSANDESHGEDPFAGGTGQHASGSQKDAQKDKDVPAITFADVGGNEEAKEKVAMFVDYIKNPEKYDKLGDASDLRAILMYGPPGSGKTMFAQAIAGETGIPIVVVSANFADTYVGSGPAAVRRMMAQAEAALKKSKSGKVLVFIDEIDAAAKTRGGMNNHQEHENTLNELLNAVDGYKKTKGIYFVAATNRKDMLDPAILRGGRFGLHVPVGLPDIKARADIFKKLSKRLRAKLDPNEDIEVVAQKVAKESAGLSGADIQHMIGQAILQSGFKGAPYVSTDEIISAIEYKGDGGEQNHPMTQEQKIVTAYHEAGHAITQHRLATQDPVSRLTIVPHGNGALGFMQAESNEMDALPYEQWLFDRLTVAMAGRAGEETFSGRRYAGVAGDYPTAERIAEYMVKQLGMSKLGQILVKNSELTGTVSSEEYKAKIDEAIFDLMARAQERAKKIILEERETIEKLVAVLLEKETLRRAEFEQIVGPKPPKPSLKDTAMGEAFKRMGQEPPKSQPPAQAKPDEKKVQTPPPAPPQNGAGPKNDQNGWKFAKIWEKFTSSLAGR